jgi:3-hydroxymyristoyl/3-hydroxydecanoyl-(acyl carrier protein) dehydratase
MNIQNYLPHRYPFLLIDKVIDIKKMNQLLHKKM